MTPAERDESREVLGHLPAVLSRYASQFRGRRIGRGAPAYCGHMGDADDLEVYLWELAQSVGRCRGMDELPEHIRECPYCLTRLRNITRALREAMTDSPLPLWDEEPVPSLVLKLSKAIRWIEQEGKRMLAEVLVVVEAAAEQVMTPPGKWTMLAPVPASRGVPGWRGITKSPDAAEVTQGPEMGCERLGIECQPSADLLVSGQIASSGGLVQARVTCSDPRTRQPCAGVFHIEYSLDGAVPQAVQAGSDGTLAIDLPSTFGVVMIKVFRVGRQVGVFRVELAPEKADG